MLLPVLSKDTAANLIRSESKVYSYHPDHLGSATWITDESGIPVQYLHYMPYGELWRNQRRTGYDERYKFTGKERDVETGYDYYPARYLWGSAGVWLSVDPLADKYPWITPYAYCAWNPVKFVDLDGRKATISFFLEGNDHILKRRNTLLNKVASIAPVTTINKDFTVVWAHGSEDGSSMEWVSMYGENNKLGSFPINIGAMELFQYLGQYNDSFASQSDNVTILASCNTGKGENSFAGEFSILSGGIVIAPTDVVVSNQEGQLRVKNNGNWNVYVGGKIVDSFKGSRGALEKFLKDNNNESDLIRKYTND